MIKLKITPINMQKSNSVQGISKKISDVVDFQISVGNDINRVIAELNKILPKIVGEFDDSKLVDEMSSIKKSIENLDLNYDDSVINGKIEPALSAIKDLQEAKKLSDNEVESLKKTAVSNQKEIRSYRKEAVRNLNLLDQRVNDMTEAK